MKDYQKSILMSLYKAERDRVQKNVDYTTLMEYKFKIWGIDFTTPFLKEDSPEHYTAISQIPTYRRTEVVVPYPYFKKRGLKCIAFLVRHDEVIAAS